MTKYTKYGLTYQAEQQFTDITNNYVDLVNIYLIYLNFM